MNKHSALLFGTLVLTLAAAACRQRETAQPAQQDSPGTAPAALPAEEAMPTDLIRSWELVRFEGGDDTVLTPSDGSKYTATFTADGRVALQIDCNRGNGSWKQSDNSLEFGPLALTRAACKPDPLTDRLARDWTYVRSYVIKNGNLYLALMADAGIYEFAPIPAQ